MTDTDEVLQAADLVEARLPHVTLTVAESAGWAIIDHLDAVTHAKLMGWLDNHQV